MKRFWLNALFALATLVLLGISIGTDASATKGTFEISQGGLGRIVTLRLPSAPFPQRDRSGGYSFGGANYAFDRHYDDPSVTVFVPKGYSPRPRADLVFFFHGWLSSRDEAASEFALFEQFYGSRVDALLVIPETAKDAPDSFGGKLEDSGGFNRLVRDILSQLTRHGLAEGTQPGRIILAGHSGAYRVISRVLDVGGLSSRTKEVYLFDALFGGEEEFSSWIRAGGSRFVCVFTIGGETEDRAKALADSLRDSGIDSAWADDDPSEDAAAFGSRIVFLASGLDHYGVVHEQDEFQRLLASSRIFAHR